MFTRCHRKLRQHLAVAVAIINIIIIIIIIIIINIASFLCDKC